MFRRNIFLTAGIQNSWFVSTTLFLYFDGENKFQKKFVKKWKTAQRWKKLVLLVFYTKADLLRLVGATFDSRMTSLRRMRKKNLIIPKSFQKKSSPFLVLFICRCWHLSCQIWIGSVRQIVICSLNEMNKMTVLYFKFFSIL